MTRPRLQVVLSAEEDRTLLELNLWLPINVDSVPSPTQMQEFQNFVDDQSHLGYAVAVHFSTGKHRTGTMLAAYLIHQGLPYESAIKTVLDASLQSELPTAQTLFLQALAIEPSRSQEDGTTNR